MQKQVLLEKLGKPNIIKGCFLFKIRMAYLASKELDGMEDKPMPQAPSSLSSSLSPAHTKLLEAIIHLWPMGLVLANSAVGARGFQRKLVAHACLRLPTGHPSNNVQTPQQDQAGITSIRALPQVCSRSGIPWSSFPQLQVVH